mmetsp:Transcript_24466/g.68676  ORF Transcript_24466/g.68676 Transcript_24466/m.68676 type:complete len:98 (+) Transcript_24466:974-1267(+)
MTIIACNFPLRLCGCIECNASTLVIDRDGKKADVSCLERGNPSSSAATSNARIALLQLTTHNAHTHACKHHASSTTTARNPPLLDMICLFVWLWMDG